MVEGWKNWEGKKVFIVLKSSRQYSGKIVKIEEHPNDFFWITIKDKFNNLVAFSNLLVELIQEEDAENE
jgi:ribosome maturation factor RimP